MSLEIQKNQILVGSVEGVSSSGEGIVRHGGTFFVPFCLTGEEIGFQVLKFKDGIGYGKLTEVISHAKERVQPSCPVFGKCGGCRLQHMSYDAQLAFKRKTVADCLKKIAGIETEVQETVPSDLPLAYRNKLQLPVGVDREGNTVIGFYAERSHRIVPISACAIHPTWAEKTINALKKYLSETGIKGYDEEKKTGTLRHLVVREINGKFIVTLVCATEKLPRTELLVRLLEESLGEVTLWLNLNKSDGNVIFGDKFTLVSGKGFFEGEELGITFEAGPQTFVQVNANVRRKLYVAALEEVAKDGDEVVIDAYSGGGLLTAMIAKRTKRVYGIELEKEASACAESLKKKNGLNNMTNICGKVEEELSALLEKERGEKLRLILDPPRAGIARSVVKALIEAKIERLVLVSCNPATLARDLGLLTGKLKEEENGELKKSNGNGAYEIISLTPYDMFPQTKHVETLVCLSKKTEKHINIDVEFGEEEGQVSLKKLQEELNEQKPKKKTTYKEMQTYIEKKYGFKVHTAYIAEVKRDLGLPMYDAPNAVEELKRPRSHPTAEMVEAIKDALKHFEII